MGKEEFWDASVEELTKGYFYNSEKETYCCLVCQEVFQKGIIYPINNVLYEAEWAMKHHITDKHHSMLHHLLSLDRKYTGLSDIQKEVLTYFYQGLSDKEIAQLIEVGSTSTIRTHRFKLKEREKQSRVFLAIMDLVNRQKSGEEEFIPLHKGATMVDDRYAITSSEKEKVLNTYFKQGLDGALESFPSKEKRKIIILQHIIRKFDKNRIYTEPEVNGVLKKIFADFATLRRYLIEYGFMDRSKDCSQYWVKK
ncbi:DUF2087 domain-containing protein [Bacillaceae bacterium S4-13-58]